MNEIMVGKVTKEVLDVLQERARQEAKWGEQNHNDYYWLGILAEEFGEAAKALIEGAVNTTPSYIERVEHNGNFLVSVIHNKLDTFDLEKELTHVAAVAIAWLEAIHRRAK